MVDVLFEIGFSSWRKGCKYLLSTIGTIAIRMANQTCFIASNENIEIAMLIGIAMNTAFPQNPEILRPYLSLKTLKWGREYSFESKLSFLFKESNCT